MVWMTKKRYIKRFLLAATKVFAAVFVVVFIIFPLVFKYSYTLQQNVIFPSFVNIPRNPNYSNPTKHELPGTRNFYLNSDDNIRLGVWHILPQNLSHSTSKDAQFFEDALNSGEHIIIYNHGNSANRAAVYRVALYKILRLHFHVIAFDYRGYGDSTDVPPTESGVVRDCMLVYQWVETRTFSRIFVWGHSLGTAISTHMVSLLSTQNMRPYGLILESPFTNMRDEISEYPLAQLFRYLPWFSFTVIEPMQSNNFIFATDKHVLNVDCPILILHAEDDGIVPFKLGYKLYQDALRYRKPGQGSIEFISFDKIYGYGHKKIFRAPELPRIIQNFVSRAIKEVEKKDL